MECKSRGYWVHDGPFDRDPKESDRKFDRVAEEAIKEIRATMMGLADPAEGRSWRKKEIESAIHLIRRVFQAQILYLRRRA